MGAPKPIAHLLQKLGSPRRWSIGKAERPSGADPAGVARQARLHAMAPPPENEATANRMTNTTSKRILDDGPDLTPRFPVKDRYTLEELLAWRGLEFVVNAYKAILHRQPDLSGRGHFLQRLQEGSLTRVEVLGRLRYGGEGRAVGVTVPGLFPRFVWHSLGRVPVLGPVARALRGLASLDRHMREVARVEQQALEDRLAARRQVAAMARAVARRVRSLDDAAAGPATPDLRRELTNLEQDLLQCANELVRDRDATAAAVATTDLEETHRLEQALAWKPDRVELEDLELRKADKDALAAVAGQTRETSEALAGLRLSIAQQERRLAAVLQALRERFGDGVDPPPEPEQLRVLAREESDLLAALYQSFEDRFRGSREEITRRLAPYGERIRNTDAVTATAPLLDIGPGRGEWLELCRTLSIPASGVELNPSMTDHCRSLGLDVVQGDALDHLRSLEADSLGAVTGFHIIEHLELHTLTALFDETLRVLRPGGVAVFETPNPENITVSAFFFHFDPTHQRPLVPDVARFIMEQRGFHAVEIIRCNSAPSRFDAEGELRRVLDTWFDGPRDYALVGTKAAT